MRMAEMTHITYLVALIAAGVFARRVRECRALSMSKASREWQEQRAQNKVEQNRGRCCGGSWANFTRGLRAETGPESRFSSKHESTEAAQVRMRACIISSCGSFSRLRTLALIGLFAPHQGWARELPLACGASGFSVSSKQAKYLAESREDEIHVPW